MAVRGKSKGAEGRYTTVPAGLGNTSPRADEKVIPDAERGEGIGDLSLPRGAKKRGRPKAASLIFDPSAGLEIHPAHAAGSKSAVADFDSL
jgi:hypothetical protein